ncbi:MFS transporter [Nocardia sp. NPDC004123]
MLSIWAFNLRNGYGYVKVESSEELIADRLPGAPAVLEPVDGAFIGLMVGAQFGVFLAFITPLAISLSMKLDQLVPGHEQYLGYVTGAGAVVPLLSGPLIGTLSDRVRGRFGRRRPFLVGGMCLGLIALAVMALADSVPMLVAGWILAQAGWGTAFGVLSFVQADRVPEEQRGKVAGLGGFASLIAPVVGVVLSGALKGSNLTLFLVPGVLGAILLTAFVFCVPEDSRALPPAEPISVRSLLGKYVFDPRRHPDFSLNWLGRFLFYFGLTFNSTYAAFYFASRLGVSVDQVTTVLGVASAGSVLATAVGALGGGFLSDRLRRRRSLVLASGIVFAIGAVVMALSTGIATLVAGSFITAVGLGMFSTVDQALALDVLPDRETQAGRYLGVLGFATSVPQSVAPFVAPLVLGLGVAAGEKNYELLYLLAAAFTVAGGLVIMRIRSAH